MNREIENQIEKILAEMTVREKIGQLNQQAEPRSDEEITLCKQKIRNGEVGSIILTASSTAGNEKKSPINEELLDELQHVAVEESRSHVPLLYGRDVIHGHQTVYPIPLACACAFNEELLKKSYRNIAREAAAQSVHWTFSPMLDLSRDPRWGRIIEGPGEDPYVGAVMARACVEGLQGEELSDEDSLLACAKHYIGYGASEGGRDYQRTEITDYSLYNYYLPAFRAAVSAGVATVMSSFNDISGQPVTSSRKYLTDILRGQLGFEGFVVSDWGSVHHLLNFGVARNRADCAALALNAGVDMDMAVGCYAENLEQLLKEGRVSRERLDEAVRRILRVKLLKGLFAHPYPKKRRVDRGGHLAMAKELAVESMVLLKNERVLPLAKDRKIALLGPFAKERRSLLGNWTVDYCLEDVKCFQEALEEKIGREHLLVSADESGMFDDSVPKAGMADVIVLALGESWERTGERRCISELSLSADQIALLKRMRTLGKPVVGVFFCGRPMAMDGLAEYLDAILYAWHAGTKTADAVCDLLFGDRVPSGKTAVTFPRRTGHIPLYYNVTPSGSTINGYYGEEPFPCYLDSAASPAYPFGYGLSYTMFRYGAPQASPQALSLAALVAGEMFHISVEITNIGEYDGKETVQLYIHDRIASRMRPLRELKAWRKLSVGCGQTAAAEFELGYAQLGFYTEEGNYLVEPGCFDIYVGENCLTENRLSIEVR